MSKRYISIAGVEIDVVEDLETNLSKLSECLQEKQSFEYILNQAIEGTKKTGQKMSWLAKALLRISLTPKRIAHYFKEEKRRQVLQEAKSELRQFYNNPSNITFRSRLQCDQNIQNYIRTINEIRREITRLEKDLVLTPDDETIHSEIKQLLVKYELQLAQKQSKLEFYTQCKEKIQKLETKLNVLKNLESAKQNIKKYETPESLSPDDLKLEKEVRLYEEYGNLLTDISNHINRISADEAEEIEPLELKSIVEKIKI